jgi:hypothetical protein
MGYRLYVYEKGKPNYDVCLYKFYQYAPYTYVKSSWEYLWPIVADQFPDRFWNTDECKEAYEWEHIVGFDCDVDASTFRKFIDLYISGRNNWVNDSNDKIWPSYIINMNDESYKKLKELYDSDCNKTLDWG